MATDWRSRALAAEADLTAFRRSFDGHVYVKDEEYAAFHARLRSAESDRDKYRKLWMDAVAPPVEPS
jgi:hypothetical protein